MNASTRPGTGRRRTTGAGWVLVLVLLAVGSGLLLGGRSAAALVAAGSRSAAPPPLPSTTVPTGPGLPGGLTGGPPTDTAGTEGKVAGMAIPNVSQQQSPDEVARLRSDGLNTIALFVWWVQPQADSDTIQPDYGNGITESDTTLELQIAASEQVGLKVILVPIFYCLTCQGGWRGTVAPSNPTAWFASYQTFIDHYADIAQRYLVTTFFAGSEMTSMEKYTSEWESVFATTRAHFDGPIGYEENWDVLGNARFLSDVDVIGVSAYFPLDEARSPTLPELLADWTSSRGQGYAGRNWVTDLEALETQFHKPILFGEVGYMSGDYSGNQPFLNYQSTTNWQLQSDLYQALLETFSNFSWWDGVVWWEWYLTPDTTADNGRSPRGKTAETLLRSWYAEDLRPPSPGTPLALSPAAYSPDASEIPGSSPSPKRSSAATGPGRSSRKLPPAPASGVTRRAAGAITGGGVDVSPPAGAGGGGGAPASGSGTATGRSGTAGSGSPTRVSAPAPVAAPAPSAAAPPGAPAGMSGRRRALDGLAALALVAVLVGLGGASAPRPARARPARR